MLRTFAPVTEIGRFDEVNWQIQTSASIQADGVELQRNSACGFHGLPKKTAIRDMIRFAKALKWRGRAGGRNPHQGKTSDSRRFRRRMKIQGGPSGKRTSEIVFAGRRRQCLAMHGTFVERQRLSYLCSQWRHFAQWTK